MELCEKPYVFGDSEPRVLCIGYVHPEEWATQRFREKLFALRPDGVAYVDGNIIAAKQGQRLTNGVLTYGNLATQARKEPEYIRDAQGRIVDLDDVQRNALTATRNRAQELWSIAAMFDVVIDVHGLNNSNPSMTFISHNATALDLQIAHTVNPSFACIGSFGFTLHSGKGCNPDIGIGDEDAIGRLLSVIEQIPAGTTEPVNVGGMALYEFVGQTHELARDVYDGLGLASHYGFLDPLPSTVSKVFNTHQQLVVINWGDTSKMAEIGRRLSEDETNRFLAGVAVRGVGGELLS